MILILAAAGGPGYYFMERQKPVNTVKTFRGDVQKLNFDGMKAQLQSNDMSALDHADITNDAYTAFFQNVNQKMSFDIKKPRSAWPTEPQILQQKSAILTALIFIKRLSQNF